MVRWTNCAYSSLLKFCLSGGNDCTASTCLFELFLNLMHPDTSTRRQHLFKEIWYMYNAVLKRHFICTVSFCSMTCMASSIGAQYGLALACCAASACLCYLDCLCFYFVASPKSILWQIGFYAHSCFNDTIYATVLVEFKPHVSLRPIAIKASSFWVQ